jgi:hypothetical protein
MYGRMDGWIDGWMDGCLCVLLSFMGMYIDKFQFVISPFCSKQKIPCILVDGSSPGTYGWIKILCTFPSIVRNQLLSWHLDLQFPELAEEIPGIINALFKSLCWLENDGNQWFSVI